MKVQPNILRETSLNTKYFFLVIFFFIISAEKLHFSVMIQVYSNESIRKVAYIFYALLSGVPSKRLSFHPLSSLFGRSSGQQIYL